jgi:N-acetylglucosaminyldiphosphoundecaprenol N-acetyl-beta-D-mannosaminyltransferase
MSCLDSIACAEISDTFEVIVIDDGSKTVLPDEILEWNSRFEMKIIRQIPLGISAARNNGIVRSKGEIIVFIDSDCRIEQNFFISLKHVIDSNPLDNAFFPGIRGHKRNIVGIMEHLRLAATQAALLTNEGYIKYINTSGFVIRRTAIDDHNFFDTSVIRGEDTLILVKLARKGTLPVYVPEAVVEHSPVTSPLRYIMNHFWIGYYTGHSRTELAKVGNILMNSAGRIKTFTLLKKIAKRESAPFLSVFLIGIAHLLEKIGRFIFALISTPRNRTGLFSTFVDPCPEKDLLARIITSAEQRKSLFITYLTAWSLVQSEQSRYFRKEIENSDLLYADGMGVVLALLLTRFIRIHKVTANNFYRLMFEELSNRKLSIALIGGEPGVTEKAKLLIQQWLPSSVIPVCASGYCTSEEEKDVIKMIKKEKPHIIILGMGQPVQEKWVNRNRELFPDTVFYCVGGLFDLITGKYPEPPSFIRNFGFEWLWRLIHSPKRLWRRYLIGLPKLGIYILKYLTIRIIYKSQSV